jgi:hypothetical protein
VPVAAVLSKVQSDLGDAAWHSSAYVLPTDCGALRVFYAVALLRIECFFAGRGRGVQEAAKTATLTQRGLLAVVVDHEPGRQWGGQRREQELAKRSWPPHWRPAGAKD